MPDNDFPERPRITRTEFHHRRWYQDWKWWASMAALLLGIAVVCWAILTWQTRGEVGDINRVVTRLDNVAGQNRSTLERLDRNQAGIDELVNFVHDIQRQQAQDDSTVVDKIYELLCASNDPIRLEACKRLNVPIPGG